jgi:hypothetical protein
MDEPVELIRLLVRLQMKWADSTKFRINTVGPNQQNFTNAWKDSRRQKKFRGNFYLTIAGENGNFLRKKF